jgi:hypothetical protein
MVGMVATPSFVILSGLLLGVLFYNSGPSFARIQARVIDRGLFLLVVGHVLVVAAMAPSEHTWTWSLSTDAIGVAMIAAAIAIPHLTKRTRLVAGFAAYAISWIIVYAAVPHDVHAEELKELLFGSLQPTVFTRGFFPIVPWTAVYVASTVLGERLAMLLSEGAFRRAESELGTLGGISIVAVCLVKAGAALTGIAALRHASSMILRVGQKYPPAPLYLLFYGGIALLFLAAWLRADGRNWSTGLMPRVAACGQSSLFIFIFHFYIYQFGLAHLGPAPLWMAPLYFAASTGLILLLASAWNRGGYNKYFTIGYEALWRAKPLVRGPALTEV